MDEGNCIVETKGHFKYQPTASTLSRMVHCTQKVWVTRVVALKKHGSYGSMHSKSTGQTYEGKGKWDNDDYVCIGLIFNGMSDSLFNIYQNVESSKELWDSLKAKYMAEDASSKKFLVSNFTNYKMTNSKPGMEQYNELLGILGRFTQHKMNMDEAIQVFCIIDKLPPSLKYFKHTLKHLKEELTLVELDSHLRIEESFRMQDSDKLKGNNVVGPSVVNMVEHNNSFRYNDNKGKRKHHDNTRADPNKKTKVTCWKCGKPRHLKKNCKCGKVGNKANGSGINGSVNGFTNSLKGQNKVYYVTYVFEAYFVQDDDVAWWVDSRATVHVCKNRCWFKTYESLNDGSILNMENKSTTLVHGCGCVDLKFSSRNIFSLFNVLHVPNIRKNLVSSSVLNNCGYKQVIESNKFVLSKHAFMSTPKLNDSILWHARLGHVHFKKMQDMSKDGLISAFDIDTEKYIGDSVVPKEVTKEVTKEVVQQPEPELRKSKKNRNLKDFGPKFQLYLTEGTKDEGFKQKPGIYYFGTYALVVRISTIRLLIAMASIHNLIIHQMDMKKTFLNGDLDEKAPKKFNKNGKGVIICLYVDDTLIFGTTRIKHESNGIAISQSYFEKVLKKFNYFDCTLVSTLMDTSEILMPNNGQAVSQLEYSKRVLKYLKKTMDCRLTYTGYPLVLEGYTDASWISKTEDNSSTSGWVFLLGGGAISWAFKKQTYITGSTMESEFVALATAGKEAE
nr:zinc finger, CCHC-type [Tanacetum cinerariifolium]